MLNRNKVTVFILFVVFACCGLCTPAKAATNGGYEVSGSLGSYDTLKQACDAINANTGEQYTITIHTNDTAAGDTALIAQGKSVTLRSNDTTHTISQNSNRHLVVRGSLVLEKIILDGNSQAGGINADSGIVTIGKDATITNCVTANSGGAVSGINMSQITLDYGMISSCAAASGGGVALDSGSRLHMTGGTIKNCQTNTDGQIGGGGVAVIGASSSFTLTDGLLTGNQTYNGNHSPGGGVSINHGSFIMKGGAVQDNKSYTYGGGVCVANDGTVQIDGGRIENNIAENTNGGGVAVLYGTVSMSNGQIRNNICTGNFMGGGVWLGYGYSTVYCRFTMSGGQISENEAAAGGGVFLRYGNSSFTQDGGDVHDNTATYYGGGIAAEYKDFIDAGNASGTEKTTVTINGGTIQRNKVSAVTVNGGAGIFLLSGAELHMSNGLITKNMSMANGGGVAATGKSAIYMEGGTITDNTAGRSGGGIHLFGSDNPVLIMSDSAVIYQNQGDLSADDVSSTGSGIITLLPAADMQLPPNIAADNWYHDTTGHRYWEGESQGIYSPVNADSREQHLTLGITERRYSVTYKDGVDGSAFQDVVYRDLEYGVATPSFDPENPAFVPVLEGHTFIGWEPEVQDIVTSDHIYIAQWKKISEPISPEIDPPTPDPDVSSPQTGDKSNLAVWGMLLSLSALLLSITAWVMKRNSKSNS